MIGTFEVESLVGRGEVLGNVTGGTLEEIFKSICSKAKLPQGLEADAVVTELMDREKVLSTAVGNGIAIPHPRKPLFSREEDSMIVVAYLNQPLDMQAPDVKKVYVMFILLSSSSQFHIKALANLAKLIKNEEFRKGLQVKPPKEQLLELIRKVTQGN